MKSITRKLLMSVWALCATAVTLTSVTYAWFASNREAWTDDFDLDIKSSDGMFISVDGENYYNELSAEMISQAIAAKRNNVGYDKVTEKMLKDSVTKLEPVTTNDCKAFNIIDNSSTVTDGYYDFHKANTLSYVQFDLWVNALSSKGEAIKTYDVFFTDSNSETQTSKITATDSVVKLNNKLTALQYNSDSKKYETKDYKSGDTITVNPINAMRVGITNGAKNYIYEPYIGMGSYAITGERDSIYAPSTNAMYTYFNNSHKIKLKALDANQIYKNTIKSFEEPVALGRIVGNTNKDEFVPVKLTISIWLEGMDADYFVGVDTKKITTFFSFQIKEVIE